VMASFMALGWLVGIMAVLVQNGYLDFANFWEVPVLARIGIARILVLRLERAANRSDDLLAQLRLLGAPLEFVAAADGFAREFRSSVLPSWVPEATCADFIGAIFASHEHAWTLAAEAAGPVLVLEDDVRLPPLFLRHFPDRLQALPKAYDLALVGSSLSAKARAVSRFVSRPDQTSERVAAFHGLWAYVASPRGARKLLHLVREARGCSEAGHRGRRIFQPVDNFIAQRLQHLRVFAFEPPPDLASEFVLDSDTHHVGSAYRQVGVVRVARLPSLNYDGREDHLEAAEMRRALGRLESQASGQAGAPIIVESEAAFRRMRTYSCWGAARLLRKVGLATLHLLWQDEERTRDAAEARRMLLLAVEALASSLRYNEGNERQERDEFQSRVTSALRRREEQGLSPVELPLKRSHPGIGWLNVKSLSLVEWLPNQSDLSDSSFHHHCSGIPHRNDDPQSS